ncbi:HAD-IA family hydrolase [Advenella mimigardefordensis]|uniref:phosphoglycolate phosphatase n=1 Tax=Advenella mimigardefordensis (strain DSM 17166 / LMG 22922 / DPN7) TaxID=1247726 RepID=W0PCK2_ADVMD|nr:HAD-IA family hydrolase [Advenella mimigardefordensis]AHG64476.1 putative hydrolase, haloacid dehalogenase (HAD) superfamily [Advenella mimigardefordensis DPN7]
MSYSLVIFDWDGTLMDSTHTIVAAIQAACRDMGFPVPDVAQASWVIGLSLDEALHRVVPDLTASQVPRFLERYRIHYLLRDPDLRTFDGVIGMLDALKAEGVPMAVATGKSRVGLNRVLDSMKMGAYFDATRTADETFSKPHPRMLEEILDELLVPAAEAVMVGDTSHDIQMAHAAGMASIAVTYGAHSVQELIDSKPTLIADTPEQLHAFLLEHCRKIAV